MKNYTILFLILALITGFASFIGFNFDGIEWVRVMCLVFTDLFVVAMFAAIILPENKKLRYQRIKK